MHLGSEALVSPHGCRFAPHRFFQYGMTAGIAVAKPAMVVISASAIPGATTVRLALCMEAMPQNELMMPHTVPSSPRKGEMVTAVESRMRYLSRFSVSR